MCRTPCLPPFQAWRVGKCPAVFSLAALSVSTALYLRRTVRYQVVDASMPRKARCTAHTPRELSRKFFRLHPFGPMHDFLPILDANPSLSFTAASSTSFPPPAQSTLQPLPPLVLPKRKCLPEQRG
jgi:hypothetical protein